MEEIIIKEVKTLHDIKQFVSFPHVLYADNPYWVPSMRADEITTLRSDKNPAFEYCEAKYWLAYKKGKIVGRIAGIINQAYIEKWKKKYVRFGWIDFIDDIAVSEALIRMVEDWADKMGMDAVHGPLGFTDFDPEGMLVDGFKELGTMQTIYNFPYYPVHFEKLGYKKDVDWLEYEITIPEKIPGKVEETALIAEKECQLHYLKVKKSKELLPYARGVFDVLNIAYKDLYGVITLSEKQINKYIKQYFSFIAPDYISIVLDKNEKVVAFAISIPSLSKALKKAKGQLFPFGFFYLYKAFKKNDIVDLYLIGVNPELQGKGVDAMLIMDMEKTFIKNGILKAITHPALEENNKVQTLWKHYETRLIKRRRCYIKILK